MARRRPSSLMPSRSRSRSHTTKLKLSDPEPKRAMENSYEDRGHCRSYKADRLSDCQRLHRLLENGFVARCRHHGRRARRPPRRGLRLEAPPESLLNDAGDNLDPDRIWATMMKN